MTRWVYVGVCECVCLHDWQFFPAISSRYYFFHSCCFLFSCKCEKVHRKNTQRHACTHSLSAKRTRLSCGSGAHGQVCVLIGSLRDQARLAQKKHTHMHTHFPPGEKTSREKTKWWNRWLEGGEKGAIGDNLKLSDRSFLNPPPVRSEAPPPYSRWCQGLLLALSSPEALSQYQRTDAVSLCEQNKSNMYIMQLSPKEPHMFGYKTRKLTQQGTFFFYSTHKFLCCGFLK